MSAWLISALERLPPRARRFVVAVVALVLIGAAITALTIAPSPGSGARSGRPAPGAPVRQNPRRPSPQRSAPPVPAAELLRADHAAERFLGSYLSFAYGRASAAAVKAVTPELHSQLVRERAQMTPAERQRHPRVVSLRVVGIMTTQLGRIAVLSQRLKVEISPLQRQVSRAAWLIAAIAVASALVFFLAGISLAGLSLAFAVTAAIGLLVGNVPKGLLPTITLSLAGGVRRMARRQALVKR